jgi:HPr kinase/phosphorylase
MKLHATCVSLGGKGVLIMGDSGSGKSDLALRLIDRGALLVADDQTSITLQRKQLIASPADTLEGLIEARGVGIFQLEYIERVPVVLVVRLVAASAVERLPEDQFFDCLGVRLPVVSLHAFHSSTEAKIRLFLQAA